MVSIKTFLTDFVFEEAGSQNSAPQKTLVEEIFCGSIPVTRYTNEFWTSKQRSAHSLHEISYRACYKPQLPRFFITRLSSEGDIIYDPFSGRGTTVIEAALLKRQVIANDVNPISRIFAEPRLFPPTIQDIQDRLLNIPVNLDLCSDIDLSMFYHPGTLQEILSLKEYLRQRIESGEEDETDRWIRMAATNRLTGHSKNFFSGYTFPPNQAVSAERQKKINQDRSLIPPYKNTKEIILIKSRTLLADVTQSNIFDLRRIAETACFLTNSAAVTSEIENNSVQLTVTSPPFLDVVQYADDNWLRCWFNDIDSGQIAASITMAKTVPLWSSMISSVLKELYRITKPNGFAAFETGEVRNGKINLDEIVVPLAVEAGFRCEGIIVNAQTFTKTANIWGISNNTKGTNSNRIVLMQKM